MITADRTVVKDQRFKRLFEPISIGKLQLKNRIVMPPMCSKLGSAFGEVTQEFIDFYVERAKYGVGLIVIENTCVAWPEGKAATNPIRLDDDKFVQGLHDLAEAVHPYGAKLATNLQHTGRQTSVFMSAEGQELCSSSSIPCVWFGDVPHELTIDEIDAKIDQFAHAVRRTAAAGFDMAQIHGAHGYLITQFMSPYMNKRTDKYGGSFENRMRFPLEIIRRSRELVGDFPIEFRMSADEGVPGGNGIDESVEIAKALVEAGVDSLSISAGIYETWPLIFPTMAAPRAVYAELGARIKKAVDVPVTLVGKLDDPHDAVRMLSEGNADLVAIGRQSIADPEWTSKVADGRIDDIRPCIHCNEGCLGNLFMGWRLSCDVNPTVGKEVSWAIEPASEAKKVLVIGGGPAGMEAACVAAERGHSVTLYEKADKLGGRLVYAGVPEHKDDIRRYVKYLTGQVAKAGVDVKLGQEATPAVVDALTPDAIIVATGGKTLPLPVPGAESDKVISATDLLAGPIPTGNTAIVVGGGHVGCEIAWHLAENGKQVKVVEMQSDWATDTVVVNKVELMGVFERLGVEVLTNASCVSVTDGGVGVCGLDGATDELAADVVVSAVGYAPDLALFEELKDKAPQVFAIGDCAGGARIYDATHDAGAVARMI